MNHTTKIAILAAGKGTRMRSPLAKVLHPVLGRTLFGHVLAACRGLGDVYGIIGHQAEQVKAAFTDEAITWIYQYQQKGTGHALQQLLEPLCDFKGRLLVINGDAPLITTVMLEKLVAADTTTLLTANLPDPKGYGRVFCENGYVQKIIEERDCTAEQRQHQLCNGGVYCFDWPIVAPLLAALDANNAQGEYYLTDVFKSLQGVQSVEVADWHEVLGVNDRLQLSQAGQVLNQRILDQWLYAGVTIVDPATTTIEATVALAAEVVIEPGSHLRGATRIAAGAVIGPGSLLVNSQIGARTEVLYSVVRDSQIGADVIVGPYAHIRAGSQIADQCRIGNFVEIKNTVMGEKTKCAHLSYLGDSTLGQGVNIGAGTITANYDGFQKNQTVLEDGVSTGANSVLFAPLTVGEDSVIAAGSVITEDVPPQSLAIARSRQQIKENWQPKPRPVKP